MTLVMNRYILCCFAGILPLHCFLIFLYKLLCLFYVEMLALNFNFSFFLSSTNFWPHSEIPHPFLLPLFGGPPSLFLSLYIINTFLTCLTLCRKMVILLLLPEKTRYIIWLYADFFSGMCCFQLIALSRRQLL